MLGAVGNAGMRGCVLTCECGLENDGDANHLMMGMGEYDWYVSWVIMGIIYWRFIQLELLSRKLQSSKRANYSLYDLVLGEMFPVFGGIVILKWVSCNASLGRLISYLWPPLTVPTQKLISLNKSFTLKHKLLAYGPSPFPV